METERTVTVIGRMGNNQKITPDRQLLDQMQQLQMLQPRQRLAASGFCAVLAELCLLGPTGVVPSSCWELLGRIMHWLWTGNILVQEEGLNRNMSRIEGGRAWRCHAPVAVFRSFWRLALLSLRSLAEETYWNSADTVPVTSHLYNVPLYVV